MRMASSDRPRLLDLFCGAGGAAMGYARAGFVVVGVDVKPQPHYPFEFHVGDALTYPLDGFDAIHASPPCQAYSVSKGLARRGRHGGDAHPQLIDTIEARLRAHAKPWVIENVRGALAQMPTSIQLCGTQFGLHVYRHRLFASSELLFAPGGWCHNPPHLMDGYLCVYGGLARRRQVGNRGNRYQRVSRAEAYAAMGIDWMTLAELSQAIPPAYTEWIGWQLLAALDAGNAA